MHCLEVAVEQGFPHVCMWAWTRDRAATCQYLQMCTHDEDVIHWRMREVAALGSAVGPTSGLGFHVTEAQGIRSFTALIGHR